MATQKLAWEGTYAPLKPLRFDTGYPQLTLFRGDDVDIETTCAMRDGTAVFNDGKFSRTPVDLTGAKLVFTMVPADPDDPDTTAITKSNALGGGIAIAADPTTGVCTISLAAGDTANKTTTVYRCFLRAQWGSGGSTTTGTVAQAPVFIIDPNETATDFSFTAGQ